MQTIVVRSTNNEFKFESGKIVDTKLVLIVSDPDRGARVTLSHGDYFDFRSSTIEVATEDGMPCDTPINFFSFIAMTNSSFKGTLSTFREIVLKSNSTINRLNAQTIELEFEAIGRWEYDNNIRHFVLQDLTKNLPKSMYVNLPVLKDQFLTGRFVYHDEEPSCGVNCDVITEYTYDLNTRITKTKDLLYLTH